MSNKPARSVITQLQLLKDRVMTVENEEFALQLPSAVKSKRS
jgi:hypothetical protein